MTAKMRLNAFAIAAVVAALAWSSPAQAQLCPLPDQTGACTATATVLPLSPFIQPKFVYELPQPVFYQPRKDVVPGFDYYEVQVSPVAPVDTSTLGVPNPFPVPATPVAGKQWLGLCAVTPPAGQPCSAAAQLLTPVWGYSQTNRNDPLAGVLNGVSTYPSMSFRATKGTPVKVRWVNNLPNQHLLCPNPLDSNSPCAIDRTLMGTLLDVNLNGVFDAGEVVNQFGGPQQPDNAVVIHLHGGEIPPDSDGFAELWFGNSVTAKAYQPGGTVGWPFPQTAINGAVQNIEPHLVPPAGNAILNPVNPAAAISWNGNSTPTGDALITDLAASNLLGSLVRPTGNSMIYNYPMVQDGATIWYHDHALGKTRINVVAGPAGYFYINDPGVDGLLFGGSPGEPPVPPATGYLFGDCTDTGIVTGKCRDIPIVFQDRAFNADGSINFPNGLGQAAPAGFKGVWNPLTPGPVPTVHPQWVPEYFGDHAVINGVIWPKVTVAPTNYRFRFLDGSNARCWTLSLAIAPPAVKVTGKPAPAQVVPQFRVIASDQGYLPTPALTPTLTMCPGERYEAVIDFTGLADGTIVNVVNTAGAPFPNGITPQAPGSPDAALAIPMQFVVKAAAPAAGQAPWVQPPNWATIVGGTVGAEKAALNAAPVGPTRFHVLNEVLDPATGAPVRVQINGKPFEAPVTEIPKRGTVETWQIINTTVDAHPMHLHLVQFEVVSRQKFQVNKYVKNTFFIPAVVPPAIPQPIITPIDPTPFTFGALMLPLPQETGFKDTAISYPGEVLTVRAKWDGRWTDCPPGAAANPDAAGTYDPTKPVCKFPAATAAVPYYQPVTSGPYVWHCHIVDHEDNEMMRPSLVMP